MKRSCTQWSRRTFRHGRYIQTACTAHGPSLQKTLLAAIKEASAPHHGFTSNDMPSHALVLISRHYFPSDVLNVAKFLHATVSDAIGDDTIQVIGGIVDSTGRSSGVSILLASEDERASVHLFEDKQDRTISVGRAWKMQGKQDTTPASESEWTPTGNWKDLMSGITESTQEVKAIPDVKEAIILSKGEFGAIDWPTQLFPDAKVFGLVPSATPFLTGEAVTMCYNDKIITSGGVALAFRKEHTSDVQHPQLKILGDPLAVTKAQGNILIALDSQPATYALLERIRSVLQKDLKISKDIQLFGQITHQGQSTGSMLPMIKIIAGDPGKGSIALSGGYRIQEGDSIQLFYEDGPVDVGPVEKYRSRVEMVLYKSPADTRDEYDEAQMKSTTEAVIEQLFTGGSSGGLILGSPGWRTFVAECDGSIINLT